MSLSLDTVKPRQTAIYSSSSVLLSYLFPPLSHFLSFAAFFLCCMLSEISTSLPVFSTPTYKAHKATAQEYKYILMQTHTHTHTDEMPHFLLPLLHSFILLAFTHSHHHPSLFLFSPLVECKNGCLGRRQLESDSFGNGER